MDSKGKDEESIVEVKNEAKEIGLKCNFGETFGISETYAKAMLYIIPLALYVPWAYRMIKGTPCNCPRPPPANPPKSQSRCQQTRSRSRIENREQPCRGKRDREQPTRSRCGDNARRPTPRDCRDAPRDDPIDQRCPHDCGNQKRQPKTDSMEGCQEHLDGRWKNSKCRSCDD
ncbi:Hypothetical protein NTJ_10701 [Nesidiocoris tenuis]|uniref:Uncharacterized protein n=1 Tax=Nesidiocoris tenuis TaxID=355587 RepID=A0ABN7B0D5_9HEMI|nr:Hypothetical protein NTJ_10701 [Nesidiocoris tenuis]